jgi:RNA polymerase sigma-70 factor, ECF subfamily
MLPAVAVVKSRRAGPRLVESRASGTSFARSPNKTALSFVLITEGTPTTMNDESEIDDHDAVLCAIATGDTGALERLYRERRVAVFAVAVSVVRDRALAEDVLHDTFVRVCEKAHTYRPATRPRAWVLEIARNLAIDSVRRRARQRPLEEVPAVVQDGPLETLACTRALMTLEPVERQIVALHVLGGLRHSEIAAQLELPPGTVRWRYRVALDRLRPLVAEGSDV